MGFCHTRKRSDKGGYENCRALHPNGALCRLSFSMRKTMQAIGAYVKNYAGYRSLREKLLLEARLKKKRAKSS